MATAQLDIRALDDDEPASRHRRGHPQARARRAPTTDQALRGATALFLIVIGVVHLHLWLDGYRYLATIGPLFLLDVVAATLLAVIVAVRLNVVVAMAAASFAAGTLGANVLSLFLPIGLFHFKEVGVSYSGGFAIASEIGVVLLLGSWTYLRWRRGVLMARSRPEVTPIPISNRSRG